MIFSIRFRDLLRVAVEVARLSVRVALGEIPSVRIVGIGLGTDVALGLLEHSLVVWHAEGRLDFQFLSDGRGVELSPFEPGVARHDRSGNHRAGIVQVILVPVVGVLVAQAGKIRTGALGTPLERPVVHALGCQRVVPVTFHLVAERANHLAVAVVAAFPHVDVSAGKLERGVGPDALHLLYGALQVEERHDLHEAADRYDDQHAEDEDDRVGLEDFMAGPE
jgi:hypothetical protein